jgi:hypothetical protein
MARAHLLLGAAVDIESLSRGNSRRVARRDK